MTKEEFDLAFKAEKFYRSTISPSHDIIITLDHHCIGGETGWLQIIHDLVWDLIELGWDRRIGQIKEKFGTLHFYVGATTEAVLDRIRKAEDLSVFTCGKCGNSHARQHEFNGWMLTRCTPCMEHQKDNAAT